MAAKYKPTEKPAGDHHLPLSGGTLLSAEEQRPRRRDCSVRPMGKTLSLILEQERPIAYRQRLALVGNGARALAAQLSVSEMNQAYAPKRNNSRLEAMQRKDSGGDHAEAGPGETHDDGAVCLFCPTTAQPEGEDEQVEVAQNALARIHIMPVEGFSASMPSVADEASARNNGVVLLYHPALGALGKESTNISESLSDFRRRFAELNYQTKFLPLVFLLIVGANADDKDSLQEFLGSCKLNRGATVMVINEDASGDEAVYAVISGISDEVIKKRNRIFVTAQEKFPTARPSRSCTLL